MLPYFSLLVTFFHRPSLVPILDLDQLSMRYPAQQVMHCVYVVLMLSGYSAGYEDS